MSSLTRRVLIVSGLLAFIVSAALVVLHISDAATERPLHAMRHEAVDAAAERVNVSVTTGIAGSALLIVLLAGYRTRAIARRVRQMADIASRLGYGDLSLRLPEREVGEIGMLERSFNAMATSLEEKRRELRQLADERAAMQRVATLVARGTPQPQIFTAVTEGAGRVLGTGAAMLLRYEDDNKVSVVAGQSEPEFDIQVGSRWAIEDGTLPDLVLRTGKPARIDTSLTASLGEHRVRAGVAAPITIDGCPWGLVVAFTMREKRLPDDAESRIASFSDLVTTAIANTQVRAELSASRARLLAAADQARRRIERDLHDGTQQRLVSLTLHLRATTASVPAELTDLHAQLSTITDELVSTLDELREISRGIHPAILSKGGLESALRTLAQRSAIPVELDVAVRIQLPRAVEVAAYYVAAEALTNIIKHADASAAYIAAAVNDSHLHLSVHDDGIGGADLAQGSGLIGLTDRVEALGGTFAVTSPDGQGTRLRAELPINPGST